MGKGECKADWAEIDNSRLNLAHGLAISHHQPMKEPMHELEQDHDPGGKVRHALAADVVSVARFSDCRRYRFSLSRTWDAGLKSALFVMMNPSTADEQVNDPTVAKAMRFARAWGYGRLDVGNVCAYRATDKMALLTLDDPVGADNIPAILGMAQAADVVVIAHGQLPKGLQMHAEAVCAALRSAGIGLHVLRLSKHGVPVHPLYLPETLRPIRWIAA